MTKTDLPLQQQVEYWNLLNAKFREGDIDELSLKRGAVVLRTFDSLGLRSPSIVELGCGSGWLANELSARGTVTAVDLADEVIARAQQRWSNVRFVAGSLFTVPLPLASFDVVVTLETIAQVYDQEAFAARTAALLKPGGHLILTAQNRVVFERLGSVSVSTQLGNHISKWLSIGELKRLFLPHFEIRRTATIMPAGHLGFLRFANSYKVQGIASNGWRIAADEGASRFRPNDRDARKEEVKLRATLWLAKL